MTKGPESVPGLLAYIPAKKYLERVAVADSAIAVTTHPTICVVNHPNSLRFSLRRFQLLLRDADGGNCAGLFSRRRQ